MTDVALHHFNFEINNLTAVFCPIGCRRASIRCLLTLALRTIITAGHGDVLLGLASETEDGLKSFAVVSVEKPIDEWIVCMVRHYKDHGGEVQPCGNVIVGVNHLNKVDNGCREKTDAV